MAVAVIMPKQGQSVESCIIGKWHKQKGDLVSEGDILFTYETDKAVFDETAKAGGVLLEVFFEEGDDVKCLETVCVIGAEGEDAGEFRPGGGNQNNYKLKMQNLILSPRARALVRKTGADARLANPSGADGRIMEADIQDVLDRGYPAMRAGQELQTRNTQPAAVGSGFDEAGLSAGSGFGEAGLSAGSGFGEAGLSAGSGFGEAGLSAGSGFEEVRLSNVRKLIAKTMHASLACSAQLTHHTSFDASRILEFRETRKNSAGGDAVKITVTDIIVYAVSRVLLKHKYMNAHILSSTMPPGDRVPAGDISLCDTLAVFKHTHIGIATDTPRGLLVPTLFYADTLTLEEISVRTKVLFDKCRQGNIEPDALSGASFTISNLGMMGIEMFTPIINPPQTGILGVCSITERTKDGGRFYPAMGLSLTYDHRALDGADASRFLMELTEFLERFAVNS